MKTRTLLCTSVGIAASGLLAAALAGPPPQFWNRPAAVATPKSVTPKTPAPTPVPCDGCRTTPIWAMGERLPAGKGVGLRVIGRKHECSRCTGAAAVEYGKVKSVMVHGAGCGPLLCCR